MMTALQSPDLHEICEEQEISPRPTNAAASLFSKHDKLAAFEYIEKLGKGSQGQVWLAKNQHTGEKVAIKQLNVHSATTWKQYELFQREAKVLENLNIPGVAPFYEYIEDLSSEPPFICIVQKYIEGQTLAEMLQSKHRFELKTVYDIVSQILQILQKLHQHEPPIIHRDIKPSNLMLTPKEDGTYTVTLLDFGAVANPQVQNGGSTVAGTFGYMPPEQLMGQCVPQSDIYALGAVAVEMLSGVAPADIEVCDFKLIIEPHLSHLPAPVVQTLNLMLEPSLEHRICDYHTLIAQFDAFARQKAPSILNIFQRTATKALQDVTSICEPGNYELWQTLDQTAETLPALFSTNDTAAVMAETKSIFTMPWSTRLSLLAMLLLTVAGLFLGSIKIGIAGIFLTLFCIAVWIKKLIERNALIEILETSSHYALSQLSHQDMDTAQSMLKIGTKIVGKITYISYFNLNHKTADAFSINMERTSAEPYYIFTAEKPVFYVRYQFQWNYQNNPILFHGELYTHTSPENHYKVGDAITLLAHLSPEDSEDQVTLSVMPYPYPFDEVVKLQNILFKQTFHTAILNCKTHVSRLEMIDTLYHHNPIGTKIALCFGDDNAAIIFAKDSSLPRLILHYYHLAIHLGHERTKKLYPNIYPKHIQTDAHSITPETACLQLKKIYSEPPIYNNLEINKWHEIYLELNKISSELQSDKSEAMLLYQQGIELESNQKYSLAMDCYERAAKQNHAQAALQLGYLYKNISNDKYQAIYWLKKAEKLGISEATESLRPLMEGIQNSKFHLFMLGSAFEKNNNIEESIFWFEQADKLGSKGAALTLGRLYMHHFKDYFRSIESYQHAYALGDNTALFHIGSAYRDAGDYPQAIHWFEQSVTLAKDKTAASSLARLYEIHLNDKNNADKWYQIARDMEG